MHAFTFTFKTPGGSRVSVSVTANTAKLGKFIAYLQLVEAGYSKQSHTWPAVCTAHR